VAARVRALLTETTRAVIGRLFPEGERDGVEELLVRQCGGNLPLADRWGTAQFERLWLALLKISDGDRSRLDRAVGQARRDWRDVLVAAGFGDSLTAHLQWAREQLNRQPDGRLPGVQ
jgi:hypothetical protein